MIKAELIAKRSLNEQDFAIDLLAPEIAAGAAPGMFVMLRGSEAVDPITPRPYSIMSIIRENGKSIGFSLLIKALGRGSRAIEQRAAGDLLPVTGPFGNPLELDSDHHYLIVAGGTGIAPAVFAVQELVRVGGSYKILYGGKSARDVHLAELDRLGIEASPTTEDGSLGHKGLVTDLLETELPSSTDGVVCFACGPWAMMKRCAEICASKGVSCYCSLERYMACGFGVCLACVFRTKTEDEYHTCCQDGPVVNGAEVDWDA